MSLSSFFSRPNVNRIQAAEADLKEAEANQQKFPADPFVHLRVAQAQQRLDYEKFMDIPRQDKKE